MILLCGIPSEPPLAMVASALQQSRVHYFVLNQRAVEQAHIEFTLRGGHAYGWLEYGNASYRLEDFQGVYLRLMDELSVPEVAQSPPDSELRIHARRFHESIAAWLEVTDSKVVNRPSAMASNNSKPFQAQLIRRYGLCVPETLITNDPELVLEFRRKHGRIIYKSISGARSIVQTLEDKDVGRLEKIRWCATQFQQYIEGVDIRVHTVGRQVFATRIVSGAVDYRYAQSQVGESAELEAWELPPEIARSCVAVAEGLGLPFAGLDLKITPSGRAFCFEVNPCPGFSYYEASAGQPIAMAVAEYLTSRETESIAPVAVALSPGG